MSEKKNNKSYAERLQAILKGLQDAAKETGEHPGLVTKAQFFKHAKDVVEWDVRCIGGLEAIKKTHFPLDEKDLAEIRNTQKVKSYISKLEKDVGDKSNFEKNLLKTIETAINSLQINKLDLPKVLKDRNKKNMTMELMVSDVHYGKKSEVFNLEICRKRMRELTSVFLSELEQKKKLFNVEKVVLGLLGDMLESFSMHGLESAIGSEFGNSKQVEVAIQSLFDDLILPIASTGLPIIIPGIPGNHDRTEHYRTYNYPGENNLTWIIYNVLKRYCELAKLTNVTFHITRDSYIVLDIYGSKVLYEHGDNLKNLQKGTIENLIQNRSKQLKVPIDMARFGHWHEYLCIDRGRAIVNESVCGQDSYAKVKGFASQAGQTINYYVETKTRPTSFYYSFPVYLE